MLADELQALHRDLTALHQSQHRLPADVSSIQERRKIEALAHDISTHTAELNRLRLRAATAIWRTDSRKCREILQGLLEADLPAEMRHEVEKLLRVLTQGR